MKALTGIALLLAAVTSVCAVGQDQSLSTQPGLRSRGAGSLRVQVFDANHAMLRTRVLIRLREPTTMEEAWDSTQDRSETVFSGLSPGTYEVVVSAPGYRTTVAHAEVLNQPDLYTVQVILQPDSNAVGGAAAAAEFSPKARKEAEEGQAALQIGKLSDAEKHLRIALQQAPDDSQVNYLLGATLLRSKNVKEAEKFFAKAVSLNPKNIPALTALGGLLLDSKDVAGGAKLLEQAVAADPNQWGPHWLLANARLMQDRNDAAVTEAQAAIRLSDDKSPAAELILGEALGNLGRYDEGIAALRKFLKQAPGSSDAPGAKQMISQMQDALRKQKAEPTAKPN